MAAAIVGFLGSVTAFLVAPRLSLALPGTALGRDDVTLGTAWRVSKRNTWRMFWAYFFCTVPWVMILGSIWLFLVPYGRTAIMFAMLRTAVLLVTMLLGIPFGMISVGMLSLAYRHFFERRADIGQ